jgi:hypothetical protein
MCNNRHRNVGTNQRGANVSKARLKIGGADATAPREATK